MRIMNGPHNEVHSGMLSLNNFLFLLFLAVSEVSERPLFSLGEEIYFQKLFMSVILESVLLQLHLLQARKETEASIELGISFGYID